MCLSRSHLSLMSPLILSKLVPDRSLSRTTTLNDMGSGTAQGKRNTQLGGGKEIFILITFHIRTTVTIVSPRTNPNLVHRALPTHFRPRIRKAVFGRPSSINSLGDTFLKFIKLNLSKNRNKLKKILVIFTLKD